MRPFRLQRVLDYRGYLRLESRQELAAALAVQRALTTERRRIDDERRRQLDELTELTRTEPYPVEAAARRRYYAGQLDLQLMLLDQRIQQAVERVEQCRRELVRKDQDVRALEQLRERYVAEQTYEDNRRVEIALGDQWQASHWHWHTGASSGTDREPAPDGQASPGGF